MKVPVPPFAVTRPRGKLNAFSSPASWRCLVPPATSGDRPLRVTHIVFDFDGGGLESLVATMARRWAGTPVVMSVISLSGREGRAGAASRPLLDQYHIVRPPPGLSMIYPASLVATLRATRPDVMHTHSGSWYKAALAARLAGVPRVVYTEHGREHYDPPIMRFLDRRAARWTDVIVAVSERLGEYMTATLGIPPRKMAVIANGVDTDVFSPRPLQPGTRERLGIPSGALVVGSVGRLEHVKAYDVLIESFASLRARGTRDGKPVFLVIGGEGSERAALEALVQRLGVAEWVKLPGWTDAAADFYRLFDVFVLSSRSEGASMSLLEAMASGASPVVTAVGGNAAILGHGLASQVVPPENQEALAAAIGKLLSSETERARISAVARARVTDRFSLEGMLDRYVALYRGQSPKDETTR